MHLIETERLYLREFTVDDAASVFALNSNPLVLQYLHELPCTGTDAALTMLTERIIPQYQQYGYGRWAVIGRKDDAFMGWCGLKYRPERDETDLGYRFLPDCWGKGYAFEAATASLKWGFENHGLTRITARAHIKNLASLRVIEKCGMQYLYDEWVDACPVKTFEKKFTRVY